MTATFSIPVPGVSIGHATDTKVQSGTTVFLFDEPATAAVHIMGGAPGTRDTELLDTHNTVSQVDALVLSGGSAYGLDAAGGVQAWLREHERGIALDPVRIPIVPCAILFDMRNEGDKDWGQYAPYRELGYAATTNCNSNPEVGQVGAAYGAKTANTPGGFGLAATQYQSALNTTDKSANTTGCILAGMAVNAVGSPLIGDTTHFWAAPWEQQQEFGGLGYPAPWPEDAALPRTKSGQRVAGTNTTIGVIVTDFALTPSQAKRLAISAHDGLARALYPVHTSADGDLLFVASTGRVAIADEDLLDFTVQATDCVTRAIACGVYQAMQDGQHE